MRTVRLIKDITFATTALLFVLAAIFSVYFRAGFLTITSRSMEPTIKAGDMVLTRMIPTKDIQSRDIVVLPLPENKNMRYSHRVISVKESGGDLVVKTQGDANPNPDKWELAITSEDASKVVAVIPTAKVFNGPVERKWIYYGLFYGGALLALYGAWRLVKK
jgi:signal peptidase I